MGIGERLKAARSMAGLSQRALAEKAGVSAMAISKYERDLTVPRSSVLIRLARALGVRVEFFLRPQTVRISEPVYRRRASLGQKAQQAILEQVREWLERYTAVEGLFPPDEMPRWTLPDDLNRRAASPEDAEALAERVRELWGLGRGPLENLPELLEDSGIKIGLVDAPPGFDALTLWVDGQAPVIVVKRGLPGDRQRFSLAHELGHLLPDTAEEKGEERMANRFAGAFLVPKAAAYRELGRQRHRLGFHELHLLKHKYGLSMQAWIYRAKDLGIISDSVAWRLFAEFRRNGWHQTEPGDALPPEEPQRMKRMVVRALTEDLISETRAEELLGMPLPEFWRHEAEQHNGFPAGVGG